MNNIVRACLYTLAAGVVLALVGCSDPLSNGYGGWYWQLPETSSTSNSAPVASNNGASTTVTHNTTVSSSTATKS